ncbi:Ras-related protein rsr1 [Orbilia oligospora]|uniref:Ras-protein rsr1 n=2 Tax=Orbiliaceae TaxID=47021 RepID=A0A7C8JCB5_ORBOL|nr:Ras-related protein rsr1 [Orbilia oligospora]KAF3093968.1 Ras-related protein rsr1 [Orbilia oligospora]KAF3108232.1 Ras-related protein rsr1 [Orbilia oligospora]KAF3120299.1 Ras-related protein rsr1 [Orbilia oligospora]KAF3120660.1 Ras-related protein rsr1 [Orbilia oligospora]
MSAPNVDKPNEGIVGQIGNSIKNAGNYVAETVQGKTAEASKEANKEQAKGNVAGKDSLSDRASGAFGAASDKLDQSKHDASARANKEGI